MIPVVARCLRADESGCHHSQCTNGRQQTVLQEDREGGEQAEESGSVKEELGCCGNEKNCTRIRSRDGRKGRRARGRQMIPDHCSVSNADIAAVCCAGAMEHALRGMATQGCYEII